ncbi:hypothetical protein HPB48_011080 [Haemaphysalis longicornis]|uniref:Uncharacterized protein n=1 Tax=Haemaphysalis longicornis TaxID=44386 RepID=A0A9J6GUP8_HAELO|nr:hypothetical protein HPB48_011080 [Haemaphysalis longicornis]
MSETSQDPTPTPEGVLDSAEITRCHQDNVQQKLSELHDTDILAAAMCAAQIENEPNTKAADKEEQGKNHDSNPKPATPDNAWAKMSLHKTSPADIEPDNQSKTHHISHAAAETSAVVQDNWISPPDEDVPHDQTEIIIPMIPKASSFAELAESNDLRLNFRTASAHKRGNKYPRSPNHLPNGRGRMTKPMLVSSPKVNPPNEVSGLKRRAASDDGIFTILLKPTNGGQFTESNRVHIAKSLVLASGRKALETRVNTRLNIATVTTQDQETAVTLLATTRLANIEVAAKTPTTIEKSRGVITRLPP